MIPRAITMIKTVAVGVSGGVDSAVSAMLLKQRGLKVIGVFMKNWDEEEETGFCSVSQDRSDAKFVCQQLRIPFHEINFVKQYWSNVFSYLLRDYESGYTPNPDILCNRHIKFKAFLRYSIDELGADAIATGHYAQSSYGNFLEAVTHTEPVRLLSARDKFKDQTFFLSQVPQTALQRVMFPVGDLLKTEVKEIAAKNNLVKLSKKKESTGICFIGKRKFQDFIADYIVPKPGPFIDISTGKYIKQHEGLHMWTVGQCCRLTGFTKRYFIARKDLKENAIYVAPGTDHPSLFTRFLFTEPPHVLSPDFGSSAVHRCNFRFQHTKPTVPCTLVFLASRLLVILDRPLKAITPGQFAVFYSDNECLGSARILQPGPSLFSLGLTVPVDYEEYEHFHKKERKTKVS